MSFLGVSKSFSNKEWVGPSEQLLQQSLVYSKSLSIPQLCAYQLIKNKVNEGDYLEYISPKIKNLMPSPKIFLDMEKGSLRLLKAIKKKETIANSFNYNVFEWHYRVNGCQLSNSIYSLNCQSKDLI